MFVLLISHTAGRFHPIRPLLSHSTPLSLSLSLSLTHTRNTQKCRYTNDTESKFGLHFLMCDDDSKCEMSLMEWFVYPLASYVLWQIFYLFVTELVCRKHIEQNPDVSTSMRWLSADRKNGFNKFCKMVRLYIYFFFLFIRSKHKVRSHVSSSNSAHASSTSPSS